MATCIFCGYSGKLSREHVFGDWLKNQFPNNASSSHTLGLIDWPEHIITRSPRINDKKRTGNVTSRYVKVVCEPCNNEWMSAIEERAKPILTALMNRTLRGLGPEDQSNLATWASKTCMTADWVKPEASRITQQERNHLKATLSPPNGWGVWMANYAGGIWSDLTIFQHRGSLQNPPIGNPGIGMGYAQSTVFGMKKVVFLIVSSSMSGVLEKISNRINAAPSIVQVWPSPYAKSILWPPGLSLDDKGVRYLANILQSPRIFNQSLNKGANWTFTP